MTNKKAILSNLEYCRLDRAAQLLDCDVYDLIHFGATRHISMYLLLDHEPAIFYPPAQLKPSQAIHFNEMTALFLASAFHGRDYPDIELGNGELAAYLCGLWQLLPSTLKLKERRIERLPDSELFLVTAKKTQITDQDVATDSAQIIDQSEIVVWTSLPDMEELPAIQDIYLKPTDLVRLWSCFYEGKKLEGQQMPDPMPPAVAEEKKTRATANQSQAIVELLRVLGFTDDNFKGSIPELQKKFATKGLGILATVNVNTVTSWLNKAGVR